MEKEQAFPQTPWHSVALTMKEDHTFPESIIVPHHKDSFLEIPTSAHLRGLLLDHHSFSFL